MLLPKSPQTNTATPIFSEINPNTKFSENNEEKKLKWYLKWKSQTNTIHAVSYTYSEKLSNKDIFSLVPFLYSSALVRFFFYHPMLYAQFLFWLVWLLNMTKNKAEIYYPKIEKTDPSKCISQFLLNKLSFWVC